MTNENQSPQDEAGFPHTDIQFPEGIEPSLNELFNRNPLEWTEDDYKTVVAHMRESRHLFKKAQMQEKKKTGKATAKQAKKVLNKPLNTLDLNDLFGSGDSSDESSTETPKDKE